MSKPTKNTYTITQFYKEYPTDDACLEKIFQMTYGKMECCPKCNSAKKFVRIRTRKSYQCPDCYMQVYPCVGTPFEKTRTPFTHWFLAIYLFTISKNGMSACELQRNIGVTYKTAFRMLQQIRKFIVNDQSILSGIVELDEAYVGGKNKNRHYDKKVEKSQGRAYKDKAPVFGMMERGGRVIACQVPDVKAHTIKPIICDKIEVGSSLMTDEYQVYNGLRAYYNHQSCDHGKGKYVNGEASTNCMENFWSNLKRTIHGSYIHVSKKYLQLYINEVIFRFNNRNKSDLFNLLLSSLAS